MLEINPEPHSSAPPLPTGRKAGLSAAERVNDIMMKGYGKIKAKVKVPAHRSGGFWEM